MTRGPNRASFMWGSLRGFMDLMCLMPSIFGYYTSCSSSRSSLTATHFKPNEMYTLSLERDMIRAQIQYYGTAGKPIHRAPHQTGAGHPSDEVYSASGSTDEESDDEESEEEWEDINNTEDIDTEDLQELPQLIAADHDAYFHHKPVRVPKHASPFSSATLHDTFCQALAQVREAEHIPDGFGILPHEWDDDEYPSHEIIRSGRQGTKELRIPLPDFIWRPRAIQ
ncbi:hypothetical protein EDB19DRAFT_1822622 [Suillus lakei]|nr:hypothetical protein EDB19DRAFT_1822622 [Suillus lakei]